MDFHYGFQMCHGKQAPQKKKEAEFLEDAAGEQQQVSTQPACSNDFERKFLTLQHKQVCVPGTREPPRHSQLLQINYAGTSVPMSTSIQTGR